MILARSDAQRVVLQFAALGRHCNRTFGGAAQAGDALGDLVDLFQHCIGNLVEQLVQGDEVRTLYVPMRLFDLALQIDGISQAIIQNDDDIAADLFRQIDLSLVHERPFQIDETLPLFCTALAANPKKESDVRGGVDRGIFRESEFQAPALAQASHRADRELQARPQQSYLAVLDAAGLAIELRAQRPIDAQGARGREAREGRSLVRGAGEYFIAEWLCHPNFRRQLPLGPAQGAMRPRRTIPRAVAGQFGRRTGWSRQSSPE